MAQYPIIKRTYFSDEKVAWAFAERIGAIKHGWVVSDFGVEKDRDVEPYYVETMEDPFATKDELMARIEKRQAEAVC